MSTLQPSLSLFAKGLLTHLPLMQEVFCNERSGGSTQSPSYCYGVWMKHLVLLWHHGMRSIPHSVLELGPGNSLGTGFSALLSGAERYIALDTVRHARPGTHGRMLRELLQLFAVRAPRPAAGWPDYDHLLDERRYPSSILTAERLAATLAPRRVEMLRRAIADLDQPPSQSSAAGDARIRYATWSDPVSIEPASIELVFSHAVMNLARNAEAIYREFGRWVKPGGWMSHQLAFNSMNTTPEWNGHLRYGRRAWQRFAGRRPFFIMQERCSTHLDWMRAAGFEIVAVLRALRSDGVPRAELAPEWRELPDEDLNCYGAFVIARRV